MATQVSIDSLSSWLSEQEENTKDNPYEIEITGLTVDNYDNIKTALTNNPTKYVDLRSTTLPDGVTSMYRTFYDCTSLVNAPVIPDSVFNMIYTFMGCTSLVNIPNIPDSVFNMTNTFCRCTSLVNAPVIPDGVTSMGYAFMGCTSLVNIPNIPDSVTDMTYTFCGCTSLVNAPVIPDGVTSMGYTFDGCTSLVNAPVIPDSVTSMGYAFMGCTSLQNIKKFLVDSTKVTIKNNCFHNTPSTLKIYVPLDKLSEWQSITPSEWALKSTDVFEAIKGIQVRLSMNNLDESLQELEPNTIDSRYVLIFSDVNSNYTNLSTALKNNPTKYVDLTYFKFPSEVEIMDETTEEMITVPVTDISNFFENCENLVIPPRISANITTMNSTFKGCTNLKSAPIIPSNVESISECFSNCTSLTQSPKISNNVTDISNAFNGCTSITKVSNIPTSAEDVSSAFENCTSLSKVCLMSSIPTTHDDCFTNTSSSIEIGVPSDMIEEFQSITPSEWGLESTSVFEEIVVNGVKWIRQS